MQLTQENENNFASSTASCIILHDFNNINKHLVNNEIKSEKNISNFNNNNKLDNSE
jgi:hypothetical protein